MASIIRYVDSVQRPNHAHWRYCPLITCYHIHISIYIISLHNIRITYIINTSRRTRITLQNKDGYI